MAPPATWRVKEAELALGRPWKGEPAMEGAIPRSASLVGRCGFLSTQKANPDAGKRRRNSKNLGVGGGGRRERGGFLTCVAARCVWHSQP